MENKTNFLKELFQPIIEGKYYVGNALVLMGYFYDLVRLCVFGIHHAPTLTGMLLALTGLGFLFWDLFQEEKKERQAQLQEAQKQ